MKMTALVGVGNYVRCRGLNGYSRFQRNNDANNDSNINNNALSTITLTSNTKKEKINKNKNKC